MTAAARQDSVAVDPTSNRLLWMATADVSPNNHLSLSLHEIVVPAARFTFFDAVQLSAFNGGFSKDFLLGVKVRFLRLEHLSVAVGYDRHVGRVEDPVPDFFYVALSTTSRRFGIHVTSTIQPIEALPVTVGALEVGIDLLARDGPRGGTKLLVEGVLPGHGSRELAPTSVMLGIRNFGLKSAVDFGLVFLLIHELSNRIFPLVHMTFVL